MKRSALVVAVVVVLLVPIVVQAHRSLQADPRAGSDVGSFHIEIHTRRSGEVIVCDGSLQFGQNRVTSLAFSRADDAARCRALVESVGALDGVRPGEHVTVMTDAVR